MDKSLFRIPQIEVFDIVDQKTGSPNLLFRNSNEKFATVLKWDSLELNDLSFWRSIANRINTLLYNRLKFEDKYYTTKDELLDFIDTNFPKYTPQEKLNIVLAYFSGLTRFEGQRLKIDIDRDILEKEIWRRFYFDNSDEFLFYIENLKEQGLVSYDTAGNSYISFRITLAGLTSLIKINEQKNSRICFVAMSFDKELEYVYDQAILPALTETGFIPYIVRNDHVESDRTINDAIIAGIKKARFTIADFTQHKAGVYFEAGYALGRGQKVIYTCQNEEISKAHFDTRNFQHIVWNNTDDLRQQLIDKIEVFIKD